MSKRWLLMGGLLCCLSTLAGAEDDPDLPNFVRGIDKQAYLEARGAEIALRRGVEEGKPYEIGRRIEALQQLEADQATRAPELSAYTWTSVGPEPIPNGQTTTTSTAVSGRTIAIAIHPTDPNKVYVGTANGGLFRTLDGGATWKALMDSAQSLAIGAITIDPANSTTVWVGTGEGNSSADSFAGVGIYRILNAEAAAPTLEGPFGGAGSRVAGCGTTVDNGVAFLGTAITRIAFDPNDNNRMFVGNTTGVAGIGVGVGLGGTNGRIGLWLSANPNAATPTFALCSQVGTGTKGIKDLVFEPGSSSNMLYHEVDRAAGNASTGVYRSTNANTATISPSTSFSATRVISFAGTTNNGELAINKVGSTVTVLSAHGTSNGRVQLSTNGGATFPTTLTSANGYCGGQCFYDIAVAIDPNNANLRYVAGNATGASTRIFARATTGNNFVASEGGLHADTHAIAIAPSNPTIIYTGNDGGIFKSTNSGVTWASLNVAGFNATQFMSLDTHPTDPEFMIGGTQDNGTEFKRPDASWTRADFGDGGFAIIDQNAPDTTNVRMFHTYFNQTNAMGYGRVTNTANAVDNGWTFFGCGFAGTANGMTCTASAIRFYAPMARGPGNPSSLYFGSDVLYRSTNGGTSMTKVSQEPIVSGQAIASIGIAPNNDNVRAVGLNNGGIFRTMTGANPLVSVDPTGGGSVIPNLIISRIAIDRNNNDIAYVTLSGFAAAGQGVWKTSNFSAGSPTWVASASGIPSIPINAFVIDPRDSTQLYAGTDIGVYRSTNSGATWSSFSAGLPRVPVFDMAFQAATLVSGQHTLRIATHGRGIWEIGIRTPPTAITEVATAISRTGATLQGIVNDNFFSTTVSFDYGTTVAYGSNVAATPAVVNSNADTPVAAVIGGLSPNTLYHYRVRATNSVGTTLGADRTFYTNDMGLQVGSVVIGATKQADFNRVVRVRFAQAFAATPIVVAQPSDEDPDPTALRVINVSPTSFDLLQVEAPGCPNCTGANGTMTVHWIAAMPGAYRLPNVAAGGGTVEIKAGTVSTTASQRNTASGFVGWPATAWQSVVFPADPPAAIGAVAAQKFLSPPVLLTALQSWTVANEGNNLTAAQDQSTLTGASQPWGTAVARSVTAAGFDVAIENSQVDDDDVAPPGFTSNEVIGYIAIQSGVSAQLAPFGGGANIGLATGSASATSTCSTVDLSFPAGTGISVPSLRGFAGKQTRTEADGGWLRRCVMSTTGGTNVRMTVRVDEDQDIDAERTHGAETIGNAIFGGDFSTTPVTLALLQSQRLGSAIDVRFSTATEVSHLGYRVWGREHSLADWRPLHAQLIVASGDDGMLPRNYQQLFNEPLISELRIEDVDILGRSRFHAAIDVGASRGAEVITPPLDWASIRNANAQVGLRGPAGADVVLAEVVKAGVQRVSVAQLQAAGLAVTAQNIQQLAISDRGVALLRHLECAQFGPDCNLEWLGQPSSSLYGPVNVYTISLNRVLARAVGSGALREVLEAPKIVDGFYQAAPNRAYSFSAPGSDPWYDQKLVASTAPVFVDRVFELPQRAPGPVSMRLSLWGGLDFPGAAPDHSYEVLLNGEPLDARRFDGLVAETIELTLPDSLLQSSNTLRLRLLADTGYAADVLMLDGFSIRYPRWSTVHAGELQFGEIDASAGTGSAVDLHADGFESRSGFAVDGVSAPSVLWSQAGAQVRRDSLNGPVALDPNVQALWLSATSQLHNPSVRAGRDSPAAATAIDYLIITHPLFEAELGPLVALQNSRGLSVRVVRSDEIYAREDHEPDPATIRSFIADSSSRFVLLVGGDSYDYANNLGLGSQSFIPTFYRAADPIVRFAATDHPFVDADADGMPERALGRIPARSVAELRIAIDSILARAPLPAQRFLAAAGNSGASEYFDIHSRSLLSYLRQQQISDFALSDEVGLTAARASTIAALSGSADWVNYLGHSSPNRWAFNNLLDTSQLAAIERSGAPAIVSQWGCWNNYFVLPNQDTMAHALMLRGNGLAAAVLGSTSLAEDASHLALGTRFFDLVEDGQFGDSTVLSVNTLGEALQQAKVDLLRNAPEHVESVYSITIFGDPAMPLR